MTHSNEKTLENVTITKQANVYYGGDVTSRNIETADGTHKTLGIMRPGDYTFETDEQENIEVLSGVMRVEIETEQSEYTAGDVFTVPPDTEFEVAVDSLIDYCCTYG